jgi:hypothetical protein
MDGVEELRDAGRRGEREEVERADWHCRCVYPLRSCVTAVLMRIPRILKMGVSSGA